jgi:hypothetical protein
MDMPNSPLPASRQLAALGNRIDFNDRIYKGNIALPCNFYSPPVLPTLQYNSAAITSPTYSNQVYQGVSLLLSSNSGPIAAIERPVLDRLR